MMEWKNVWSRSGSRYRLRAVVLLAVNVLLFAGVGAFAFWIRSGTAFAPTMDGYWDQMAETFRFTGERGVSLGSMLAEPINVEAVPMQIPILGLLMATLIGIPILVAILYGFWAALPFIAIIGFLAVMPWLAITLLGSCIIASARPFRTPLRFVSALLGLVPAVAYLVLASVGTAEVVAGRIDPIDTIKFTAPWLLAVVAAALLFALVLAIAKLVDYRTGAITPLLAVMFGTPVMLFEFCVGRDELSYRLLEALSDAHFEEVYTGGDLAEAAQRAWERHPLPRPRWQTVYEMEAQKWQMALAADIQPFLAELAAHQAELAARCDGFVRDFPDSRYVHNAVFLKARALDTRIDEDAFRRTRWIRYYQDFPSVRSRQTWRVLCDAQPHSVLGAVALLRLAQLEARDGEIDRALQRLAASQEEIDEAVQNAAEPLEAGPPALVAGELLPARPEASLHVEVRQVLLNARRLRDLCASNRDPVNRDAPLSGPRRRDDGIWFGLLDLDPRDEHYPANVARLQAHYPNCVLQDNLRLEAAKAVLSAGERVDRLEECVAEFPDGDAYPEALFRLAAAYKAIGRATQCEAVVERLQRANPSSIWAVYATRLSSTARMRPRADAG